MAQNQMLMNQKPLYSRPAFHWTYDVPRGAKVHGDFVTRVPVQPVSRYFETSEGSAGWNICARGPCGRWLSKTLRSDSVLK